MYDLCGVIRKNIPAYNFRVLYAASCIVKVLYKKYQRREREVEICPLLQRQRRCTRGHKGTKLRIVILFRIC